MTKEAPMKKLLFQVKTEHICVTNGGKKTSLAAILVFDKKLNYQQKTAGLWTFL